ncbi:hypothetical protein Gpo141_00010620 [Globisporangium polare]
MVLNSSVAVAVGSPPTIAIRRVSPQPRKEDGPRHKDPNAAALVFVSPSTFRRVWFALVFAHLLSAAFVTTVGVVYVYLRQYYVLDSLVLYGVVVEAQYLSQMATMYFVLAGIHSTKPPRDVRRGLKLYQCTILTWDSRTALTNSRHPEMLFVFLVDVNMTELPQGLQSTDFPKKLSDIEMYGSNVSRLPDSLASIWPSDMFLIVENCQFQQVPSAIPLLKPRFLSLALNNISSLPVELLEPAAPIFLFLDGNPIQSLPTNLTSTPLSVWFSFRESQVASLPDWIDEQFLAEAVVPAGGTPLCSRLTKLGLASETAHLAQMGMNGLDCSSGGTGEGGEGYLGWYPIGDEEPNNPTYALD